MAKVIVEPAGPVTGKIQLTLTVTVNVIVPSNGIFEPLAKRALLDVANRINLSSLKGRVIDYEQDHGDTMVKVDLSSELNSIISNEAQEHEFHKIKQ